MSIGLISVIGAVVLMMALSVTLRDDHVSAPPAPHDSAQPDTAPPPPPMSEQELVLLEPAAMLGRLTPEQVQRLHDALDAAPDDRWRDRYSRILMAHLWSSGDKASWEVMVQRHLATIDATDPDISYKLTLHLSKLGPERAEECIKWAEVALMRSSQWTGRTWTRRVYALHKIRAAAAQQLWQQAEQHQTDQIDVARERTKRMAIEWHQALQGTQSDYTLDKAIALCRSGGGTPSECTGGAPER